MAGGVVTFKVNWLVLVKLPAVPVRVMVEVPVVAVDEAVIARLDEQVGLQEVGENEWVTPVGKPEATKVVEVMVPESKVAVILLLTDDPLATLLLPPLVRLKSKVGGMLTEQEAVLVVDPDVTLMVAFLVPADE